MQDRCLATQAKEALLRQSDPKKSLTVRTFFKHCHDDVFLGVSARAIRKIAKEYSSLALEEIQKLMNSCVHEERSLAHAILCMRFQKADENDQAKIVEFYLANRDTIRDWDGVDNSAPYILGPFLLNRDKKLLYDLALSKSLWDRRIAIVSTWWFIRHGKIDDALRIAQKLLFDKADLIHKATGWMLREVGKRSPETLVEFLSTHHKIMPRTMLRYAIERFPAHERQQYLKLQKLNGSSSKSHASN